ncbi:MAG: aldehyde dehydrogenase [Sphingomonadales bacterium]|nr:aldehyde dehydrogenase [Sphingomonadales bacterium]
MSHEQQFYIDGQWVNPVAPELIDVINPSDETTITQISMGSPADVDRAVAAAKEAFKTYSVTSVEERIALLNRIIEVYERRRNDLAAAMSLEMGAPRPFAFSAQAGIGLTHLKKMVSVLSTYEFSHTKDRSIVVKEAIGVVGLITPWNWPMNQITCKVAPALAAGCTMVLKPSEIAPLNAIIFAEILDEAGVPPGVFNLVNGDGMAVGNALSSHPDVDMMSFTGSTRAGILVAKAAADTVKRVHQELGGKSANILFPDVDFPDAVAKGIAGCFGNSGQSCNAPTRMFVPRDRHEEVIEIARTAAKEFTVGPADKPGVRLGPVTSALQYDKIQEMIEVGIAEGATLVAGGLGKPEGLDRGYFVRPTVFANVSSDMRVARDEIFGPVLAIIPYDDVEDAIDQANDSVYGLASYVQAKDIRLARLAANRLKAGSIHINYPPGDVGMPFGGYKQSGNGREYAEYGLEEFLETKGIIGYEGAD